MRVIVKKNNLRYRIPGVKDGLAFIPKIGDMISLPSEIADLELKSGNVRNLLKEEQEMINRKIKAKKEKQKKEK